MVVRALVLTLSLLHFASAYSVLTHEALVDAAWDQTIRPVLIERYPSASTADLQKAHAYAYGGAIIQDLGYYPFGSRFFSDLVHYIRGGDFVEALLSEAQDLNELAFALGALAHDAADNCGHPIGINRAVPLVYPKLHSRFGNEVTFADHPTSHLKVEFGFDVVQVAQGNYARKAYHDFIGFEVAADLLERAFRSTYSLELKSVFLRVDLALGTFRWAVAQLIPEMTKAAWALRESEIRLAQPGITRQRFLYNVSRASFEQEWGREYERPGFFARFLAALFRLIPKVGPFRALGFRAPGPEAQKLVMESFNQALDRYRQQLGRLRSGGTLHLGNENFDTGKPMSYGVYRLADRAVDKLVRQLADKQVTVSSELRAALTTFYDGKHPQDRKALAAWMMLRITP
jgi:hypothetical protein